MFSLTKKTMNQPVYDRLAFDSFKTSQRNESARFPPTFYQRQKQQPIIHTNHQALPPPQRISPQTITSYTPQTQSHTPSRPSCLLSDINPSAHPSTSRSTYHSTINQRPLSLFKILNKLTFYPISAFPTPALLRTLIYSLLSASYIFELRSEWARRSRMLWLGGGDNGFTSTEAYFQLQNSPNSNYPPTSS